MISTTEKAAQKLKETLLQRLFGAGIGFRISTDEDKSGHRLVNIVLDNRSPDDRVIDSNGVKVFVSPDTAKQLRDFEVDYLAGPVSSFYLKRKGGHTRRSRKTSPSDDELPGPADNRSARDGDRPKSRERY